MAHTAECLLREVNGEISPPGNQDPDLSLVAQAIREKASDVDGISI
jgi:hypothetical protein